MAFRDAFLAGYEPIMEQCANKYPVTYIDSSPGTPEVTAENVTGMGSSSDSRLFEAAGEITGPDVIG